MLFGPAHQKGLSNRLWIAVACFVLQGCFTEEDFFPGVVHRSPLIPSLSCTPYIQDGYTEKISYYPGDRMKVFFQSGSAVDLCRLTVFTVNGDSVYSTASGLSIVPEAPDDASENGYDFPASVEFSVPRLPSGIYLIDRRIPFIVKTAEPVDMMIIYPSNTANAYAESGGKSLYSQQDRPVGVSFHRPVSLQRLSEVCLKWFATITDFRMGYVADVDMDNFETIGKAKILVIPGHSEYWTREARKNFDQFVNSGGHALILSGNTMWWQVRYSDDKNKMICYKNKDNDPIGDPLLKTIEWNSSLLQFPVLSSIGADFSLGGYGLKSDQGWNGYKIIAPASPLFEGLDLKKGDIITLPSLEYDGSPVSGYDEAGYPILDREALGFEKIELLGFDKGFRVQETVGTFIVFQKTQTSGIVINTASTDWCSSNGMGGKSGNTIKQVTYNALHKLINDAPVFSH